MMFASAPVGVHQPDLFRGQILLAVLEGETDITYAVAEQVRSSDPSVIRKSHLPNPQIGCFSGTEEVVNRGWA